METKFVPSTWNASGDTLKLHGRSRRHWNFVDVERKASCYITNEIISTTYNACHFIQITPSCKQAIHFFDYLDFMVCHLNIDKSVWGQVTMITLALGLFTFYSWLLYIVIVYFVVPNLLTLHKILPTNNYHYGVIVIANLLVMPRLWFQKSLCEMPEETSSLLLSEFVGNIVTTFSVSIAVICYKQSYMITNWHFTGNMLLLILSNVYVAYLIHVNHYNNDSPPEKRTPLNLDSHAKAMIVIYMIYLFYYVFTSRLFFEDKNEDTMSVASRDIQTYTKAARSSNGSVDASMSYDAQWDLDSIHSDVLSNAYVPQPRSTIESEPSPNPEAMLNDARKAHEQALIPLFHQRKQPIPVKCLMWPMWVIVAITIPVIDDNRHLSGWCKYLVCTSLLFTPVMAKIHNLPTYLFYAILVFAVVGVKIIYSYSHAGIPPRYYRVFSVIGIINGLAISHIIGFEINALAYQMLTYIDDWNLHSGAIIILCCRECITVCFSCWGLSAPEHSRKAFGTIFGVAIFYTLIGIPIVVMDECFWLHEQISMTTDAATTYIFLAIILLCTMFSVSTTRFEIRPSHGGFLIIVFCLYVLYERLAAKDIIHAYGSNHKICVHYNPNDADWA